jgi:uncharacterized Zn-binding protein involved in type VI secretion
MPLIVRFGDPGSHGGAVCSSATRSYAEGILISRIGDTYCCPIHGPNPIVTGCSHTHAEGPLIAFDGSLTACGATISATASHTWTE